MRSSLCFGPYARWIVIRIAKGGSSSLWLLFGAVAGIGLENKHTMLVFGFAIVAGLLISDERRLLDSKWIWIGGAIALALFLPNLIWEARHGWPQIARCARRPGIQKLSGWPFAIFV